MIKYKLIQFRDNKIVLLSNETIKKKDWYYTEPYSNLSIRKCMDDTYDFTHCQKIIAANYQIEVKAEREGNNVWINLLSFPTLNLSLVENQLGIINIEKLAETEANKIDYNSPEGNGYVDFVDFVDGYTQGFTQSEELNKKKFTLEDLKKAIELAKEGSIGYYAPDSPCYYFDNSEDDIIKILLKPKEWNVEIQVEENNQIKIIKIL